MRQIAPNVYQLRSLWPNAFNVYYIETAAEGVVVDASTRWAWPLIRKQLQGRKVTALLLTHAHPDHQGCAAKICERWNASLLVHEADAASAEGKAPLVRQSGMWEFIGNAIWAGPRSPVARRLREGDDIAGFTVVHLPGHTPGHIGLFRRSDGVFIVGDAVNTNDYLTGLFPVVREPPRVFSLDPAQNRLSVRKLCTYGPSIICPGHGPPLRSLEKLRRFAARLPA